MAEDTIEHRLAPIIECGRAGDYHAIEARVTHLIPFRSDLMLTASQHLHDWLDMQLISAGDVTPLAKVLTVAENLGALKSGSTNMIYRVAHLISKSDLDWLYRNASNPYVPFGSNGRCRRASTVDGYRQCQEGMQLARESEVAQRQSTLAQKRLEGHARLDVMRNAQGERTALRNYLIENLRSAPVGVRLAAIMESTRPIHYFPEEFAEVPPEAISELSPELLRGLAKKLERAKKGPWRRLLKELSV